MGYEREPAPGAYFGPLAVALILRHCTGERARREPVDLDELAARYQRGVEPETVEAGRQLRHGLALARVSERLRKEHQAGAGSVDASSEVPESGGGAASVLCPPGSGSAPRFLSVVEVATRLDVSAERVRQLCGDGGLVATRLARRGRPWRIDEASVLEYERSRRSA